MIRRRRRSSALARALRSPAAHATLGSALLAGTAVAAKLACNATRARTDGGRKRRFRLEVDETPKQGVSRVARDQLDLTIGLLEGAPEGDGARAVHEARKALKRLRALLRVSRPALDERRYRRENMILRDAGRALSAARDAQVMLETLDSLTERFADELARPTWLRLREDLLAGAERAQAQRPTNFDGVLDTLSEARTRVSTWPLPQENGRVSLADGFRRIYRRGRRALRRAQDAPTPENLHGLRKRAKDLWHAAQLLEPVCPAKMRLLAKSAHQLADLLGDDHDLSVLLEYAQGRPELLEAGELELLVSVVDLRRQSLRRLAFDCASDLYRRKPKRQLKRLALA